MKRLIVVAIAVIPLLIGCQTDMSHIERGNITSANKVLVVGTSSDFKQKVISQVMESKQLQQCYFNVIGLNQVDKVDTEPYQVILFVTTYMAGHLDGRVTQFLQKDPLNAKIVVFYTVGDEDHPPSGRHKPDIRVDAVASASKSSRVQERADELVALIEKRFTSQ